MPSCPEPRQAPPGGALTLVDVPGPIVDLTPLLDARPIIRGVLHPLRVRPEPGAQLIALTAGQRFTPAINDGLYTFHLPDAPTTLVALWTDPPRLTRRPVPSPRLEASEVLVLDARTPLTAELLIAFDAAPPGRITVELTEQGLRTGLTLADGLADTTTALVVPRPVAPAEDSGLWITAVDQSTGVAPRRAVTAAVPLDRDGALLTWDALPTVEPPPRDPARALPLDRATGWMRTDQPAGEPAAELGEPADPARYTEITLEGRGACTDSRHRVILPAGAPLIIPPLPGPDPFDAPLIFARISTVHHTGAPLADLLIAGPTPLELPLWIARRATATLEGYWESGTETCDPPLLRGLYTLTAPADTCDPAVPAPRAAITRSGHLIALDGDATSPLGCGRFIDTAPLRFETRGIGSLPVARDGATLTVPTATGAVRLTPIDPPTAIEPAATAGDYTRFTLARQDIDREGRATGDPIVIDGGLSPHGPAATLNRGELRVRTRWWSFDAHLTTSDNEAALARASTGGCTARPQDLRITWTPNTITLEGDAPSPLITPPATAAVSCCGRDLSSLPPQRCHQSDHRSHLRCRSLPRGRRARCDRLERRVGVV